MRSLRDLERQKECLITITSLLALDLPERPKPAPMTSYTTQKNRPKAAYSTAIELARQLGLDSIADLLKDAMQGDGSAKLNYAT